jgi:tripartite-type tricarboxylate transporter receptor subunit TctC
MKNVRLLSKLVSAAILTALALFATGSEAAAQAYPAKPVRLITLTAAGGSLDILARLLAQNLSEQTGQQFIVENKVGAGGNVGVAEVARSAPDGYTIGMMTSSTHGINPSLYGSRMPYDALNDFEFIALAAELKNVVVVNPGVPATNMQELAAYARANPGKLNFGSAGTGTSQHLAGEMLKMAAHIEMTHVPFRGAGQAATSLVAGEIQLMFSSIADVLPFIQDNRLRAIAVTSKERSRVLPDIVPVAEQGFPDYDVKAWFGVVAPRGTPAAIVSRLHDGIVKALAKPEAGGRLASIGMDPPARTLSTAEVRTFVRAEIEKWGKVVAASGAKAD